MKVLFVTRGFPSDEYPMDGNYEAVQAKALAACGCQVGVICVTFISIFHLFRRSGVKHRVVDGVTVYECTRIGFSSRFLSFPGLNDRLRTRIYKDLYKNYVRENDIPDIVHAHLSLTAAPSIFLKEEFHIPFIITEHWSKAFRQGEDSRIRKLSSVYNKADQVVCVSQALSNALKDSFGVNSLVINNMVSDVFFKQCKVERHDQNYRFIACGAFRKDGLKGFDILVDAFAKANFADNVSLDIIGSGPDLSNIKHRIECYGLSGKIHLLGMKKPEEVSILLCNSDCFVLSSRTETFSIVVIEAMAKGLPIIATRCGGPETFIRQEHGLLVERENVNQLSDAMKYMTKHSADYDSCEIREFCQKHFSQDVIANQIIELYNEVLQRK